AQLPQLLGELLARRLERDAVIEPAAKRILLVLEPAPLVGQPVLLPAVRVAPQPLAALAGLCRALLAEVGTRPPGLIDHRAVLEQEDQHAAVAAVLLIALLVIGGIGKPLVLVLAEIHDRVELATALEVALVFALV